MMKYIDQKDISAKKQLLCSLGVYELRGLARTLGIKSPSTKPREQLIEELAVYFATGSLADRRETNKGRPSKPIARINEILSAVTNGDNEALSVIFEQMVPSFTLQDNADKVLPTETLQFKGGELLLGGRNAIETSGPLFSSKPLQSLLNEINKLECDKIFIGCNLTSEDKILLQNCNFVYFATDYSDQFARGYDLLIQALGAINERAAKGEDVVVIVNDIGRLIFDIDKKFVPDGCEHSAIAVKTIKSLMSVASAYKSGRTTTLLVTYNSSDLTDKLLSQDVIKICNKL